MSTNFPTSIDSYPTRSGADTLATGPHSTMHNDLQAAVVALETKVGIDTSAVVNSLDFKSTHNARVWYTASASDPASTNPSEIKDGDLWVPTDGAGSIFVRNSGAWFPQGPLFAFTPPNDGAYTWLNQGGASVDTTKGGIVLTAPGGGSGANLRMRYKTAPSPPYVITAYLLPCFVAKPFHSAGLFFRESSSGKLHVFDIVHSAGTQTIRTTKFSNPTTFVADYQTNQSVLDCPRWLQIEDNNTNRICRMSSDGQHWVTIHSISRTDYLTGGADQVGFCASAENSTTPNLDCIATLLSWKES